jgi:hypothetical protein
MAALPAGKFTKAIYRAFLPESLRSHYAGQPDAMDEQNFVHGIRQALAHNQAVVISGWYPDCKMEFSLDGFARFGHCLGQRVQFHGRQTYTFIDVFW